MSFLRTKVALNYASSQRWTRIYKWPYLQTFLAAFILMSSFSIVQGQVSGASHSSQPASSVAPILSFTAPAPATVVMEDTVTATLKLTGNADASTLRVMLNKTYVTDSFSTSACSSLPCNITARLNVTAAVTPGWNNLYATLTGKTGNAGIARTRFFYNNGVSAAASSTAVARPPTSVLAGLSPQADATAATNSGVLPPTIAVSLDFLNGVTLGSANYPVCSALGSYSFYRFDQTTLLPTDIECLSVQSLPDLISGLGALPSGSIIALISPVGSIQPPLNFASVGGTDFTQKGAPVPDLYQLIGYSQASPGQAYESYRNLGPGAFLASDLRGNLVNTGASGTTYTFQPTDSPAFVALANISGVQSFTAVGYPITLPFGSTTPTNWSLPNNFTQKQFAPNDTQSIGQPGFVTIMLSPTDLSVLSEKFYATGTDPNALQTLGSDLIAAANGTIIILTSQGGNPFAGLALPGPTPALSSFCGAVSLMQVSEHACVQAGLGGSGSISMIGVMENVNQSTSSIAPGYKKWYSSTYESGQNDSGSLSGLFRRDHSFHLVPYEVGSFTPPSGNYTVDSLLSFALPTQVGSATASPWPMLDTPGHQAAYQYLSNAIVGKVLFANGTCTVDAAWCNDVRAWYAGSEVKSFAGLDLTTSPAYSFPSSVNSFTESDFNAVRDQLQAEFTYLNNELNYEGWFDQATNSALINTGSAISAAANEVENTLISQYASIPPPPVSLASSLLSIGQQIVSVGAAIAPPAHLAGIILDAVSDGVSATKAGTLSSDPAVVQVADLITSTDGEASLASAQYNLALQAGVSSYFASVRSDWFKLQSFGILTSQPSNNGWYVQDTGGAAASGIAAESLAKARTSFYFQLLPQYFTMDWMFDIPIQGIVNSGTSLSTFNEGWAADYLESQYSNDDSAGEIWPAPDFAQFSLPSLVNSTCQDYSLVASLDSVKKFNNYNYRYLQSWGSSLADVLFGPSNGTNGLGNLNLSQNTFYDFAFGNIIQPPVLKTNVYSTSIFNDPFKGATCAMGSLSVIPPQESQGAMLVAQPSASSVAVGGSITVAVSLKPSSATATATPTGTISILRGNKPVAIASLVAGTSPVPTATLQLSVGTLAPGTYTYTVAYAGDSNYGVATASMNLQVLSPATATTTTLNIPAVAYQGQNLQLQAGVSSAAGVPPGSVSFEDGSANLGSVPVDAAGNASLPLNTLGLGTHSITAVYAPTDPSVYGASQSQSASLLINPISSDISLSLSSGSVVVPAGAQSAPVKLTVSSVAAYTGQVNFSCVGLPLGTTCTFSPSQVALAAATSVSTNFTISQSSTTSSAGIASIRSAVGLLGFLMSTLLVFQLSRGRLFIVGQLCIWAILTVGIAMLAGCAGGGGAGSSQTRQTGTTTVLVTVTSGTLSKSTPLTVTLQ